MTIEKIPKVYYFHFAHLTKSKQRHYSQNFTIHFLHQIFIPEIIMSTMLIHFINYSCLLGSGLEFFVFALLYNFQSAGSQIHFALK